MLKVLDYSHSQTSSIKIHFRYCKIRSVFCRIKLLQSTVTALPHLHKWTLKPTVNTIQGDLKKVSN